MASTFLREGAARARMPDDPAMFMIALVAAVCIGVAKADFTGISMVCVMLLAEVYGAKASVGLALPRLIAADLMTYPAFLKNGSWQPVWKLLPATLVGLGLGWWLLGRIDDTSVRRIIGGCVLLMVLIQALRKRKPVFFHKSSMQALRVLLMVKHAMKFSSHPLSSAA
jgi:uncharacterized membrane protein YfcA